MIFDKNTAKKTAELLLQINAIKLQPQEPFTWASGWKSPIYCDNRITLSFPPIRNYLREQFAKHIENEYGKPDVIAGVATGAIGIGILVANVPEGLLACITISLAITAKRLAEKQVFLFNVISKARFFI